MFNTLVINFIGFFSAAFACFIAGAFYLVMCQWGCKPLASPALYLNILFWVFLMLSIYFLTQIIKLILSKNDQSKEIE